MSTSLIHLQPLSKWIDVGDGGRRGRLDVPAVCFAHARHTTTSGDLLQLLSEDLEILERFFVLFLLDALHGIILEDWVARISWLVLRVSLKLHVCRVVSLECRLHDRRWDFFSIFVRRVRRGARSVVSCRRLATKKRRSLFYAVYLF